MSLNIAIAVFELVMMVLSISLHDCAQAWMASRLGDPTGRMLGRISMNPAKHFDLFGMLIWPLLYVFRTPLILGWGKPVPMTSRNFRGRDGEVKATLAGPAAQLLLACVCLLGLVVLKHTSHEASGLIGAASLLAQRVPLEGLENGLPGMLPLILLLYLGIYVNLLLFAFNLVPAPFLDGGKILVHYLPYNAARAFEQYSMYIMIAFFFVGFRFIMLIFGPLFGIFNGLLNHL